MVNGVSVVDVAPSQISLTLMNVFYDVRLAWCKRFGYQSFDLLKIDECKVYIGIGTFSAYHLIHPPINGPIIFRCDRFVVEPRDLYDKLAQNLKGVFRTRGQPFQREGVLLVLVRPFLRYANAGPCRPIFATRNIFVAHRFWVELRVRRGFPAEFKRPRLFLDDLQRIQIRENFGSDLIRVSRFMGN